MTSLRMFMLLFLVLLPHMLSVDLRPLVQDVHAVQTGEVIRLNDAVYYANR